ncbi:DUF5655 domain-containing protein [Geodermatophilus marinus]|uniref:DUF5655 domain-containing protein n=1 Tax=Geodermatophilus sp. LHW52908 TaxID=2303986 RepID=UPI0018F5B4ED|nr:DUF5655 domain-containing protein [Geodermatophilus sp. LHW52908]
MPGPAAPGPTPEDFFAGSPAGLAVHRRVAEVLQEAGGAQVRVGRSQVTFRRRRGFAWLWRPGRYLRGPVAEVVLSVALGRPDPSPRWKQVVHPSGRHWVHHLEVRDPAEIDGEVAGWLREAAGRAG